MTVKELIADYCENQANWRAERALEYPEDSRNERSAAGLRGLAMHVRSLPDLDPRLLALDVYGHISELKVFAPCEDAAQAISHFHFHDPHADPDQFIDQLVNEEERGAADRVGTE